MSNLATQARAPRVVQRTTQEALRRAKLSVVPDRVEAARRAPFVAFVALILAAGVAGLLAFNTSMQQASFRATALEHEADAMTASKQSLAMALAAQRDPQELARRAKALGMVPPPDPAFVRLVDGAVLGTPTPATADDAIRINPLPAAKPSSLAPKPRIVKVPAAPGNTDVPVASTTDAGAGGATKKPHRHTTGAQ